MYNICKARKRILNIDLFLSFTILLLAIGGIFILYSASHGEITILIKQGMRVAFGFLVMLICASIAPHTYARLAILAYVSSILLLILVHFLGVSINGSQRWLNLGIINLQPSEFLKITIPLILAALFTKKSLPPSLKEIFIALIILFLPFFLIIKQPDLGTAILILFTGGSVIFLAGIAKRFLFIAFFLFLLFSPKIWDLLHPYQKERIITFINPKQDVIDSSYHIIQSQIAIGSGGVWGTGYTQGSQTNLDFIPADTTDFVFAVLAEELGLLGNISLWIIYLIIILRGFMITLSSKDSFTRLLAGGIITMFFLSVFVNIAMVSGLLPVVGVPLPFISYGGSYMVSFMAGFGILISINKNRKIIY